MNTNTGSIEIRDIVFLHRPIYNHHKEIIPEEKKIRPYCVLDIIGDELLVVGLTTKEHTNFTYQVKNGSYAMINELYLINSRELNDIKGKVSKSCFNKMIELIYDAIITNYHILFNEHIKNLFMDKYQKVIEDKIFLLSIPEKEFHERDIIYSYENSKQKYIIDKIYEDGYLCYRINLENDVLNIDFNSHIMLSKDGVYFIVKNISEEDYNNRQRGYLKKKYANTHSDYHPKKKIYYQSGDILKCNGKEYFLIYENSEQKLVCIPYQGNYLLDHIKYLNKYECKKLDIRLSNKERVSILKKVSSNLQIYHNEFLQNAISAKIKKL